MELAVVVAILGLGRAVQKGGVEMNRRGHGAPGLALIAVLAVYLAPVFWPTYLMQYLGLPSDLQVIPLLVWAAVALWLQGKAFSRWGLASLIPVLLYVLGFVVLMLIAWAQP